jgi:hypothetical protein
MGVTAPLDVCRDFIQLVIPGLKVIFGGDTEPTAPRPNVDPSVFSYAAIEIQSDDTRWATVGERTTDTVSGDKVEQIRGLPIEGVLAVEFYGDSAEAYARTLRLTTGRADVIRMLDAAGDYAIDTPSQVTRDYVLRSGEREPGASITFAVKWIDSETYDTEGVDTITTTVTVTAEGA